MILGLLMKLQVLNVFLFTNRPIEENGAHLRGFIGAQFPSFPSLHHHISNSKQHSLFYRYPSIQYHVHEQYAIILAIGEENISILRHVILNLKTLSLGNNDYPIVKIKVHYSEPTLKISSKKVYRYKFLTPWLAFNEKNKQKYKSASLLMRRNLLKKILIGNILSMCKYLNYHVPSPIHVELEVHPINILFKGIKMTGFTGMFETNFKIPNYFGLGKAVSRGYGSVYRLPPLTHPP